MSAAITTVSSTLENQLFEIIEALADKQGDETSNANGAIVVSGYTRNNATGVISCTISLPTTDSADASTGGRLMVATEVFDV